LPKKIPRVCHLAGLVFDCDFAPKNTAKAVGFQLISLPPTSLLPMSDESLLFVFRFDYFCKKLAERAD